MDLGALVNSPQMQRLREVSFGRFSNCTRSLRRWCNKTPP